MANSYKDPSYDKAENDVSSELGLPPNLLASIRLIGEQSNHDQTSELGAKSVYQIMKPERDVMLKRYGVDAWEGGKAAAWVAGKLLKESLQRNSNDATAAVREYIGGTDPKNWGKTTKAYTARVMNAFTNPAKLDEARTGSGSGGGSPYSSIVIKPLNDGSAEPVEPAQMTVAQRLAKYNTGKMQGDELASFEQALMDGNIVLPDGKMPKKIATQIATQIAKSEIEAKKAQATNPAPTPEKDYTGNRLGEMGHKIGEAVSGLGAALAGDGGVIDTFTGIPRTAYGLGEGIVSGGAGMISPIVSGLAGLGAGAASAVQGKGFMDAANNAIQGTQNAIAPYMPMPATNMGKAILSTMGLVPEGIKAGAEANYYAYGNPLAAATIEGAGNVAAALLGLRGVGKVAPEVAAAERTRQQITTNPPIERAAPQAAEVAPIVEPSAPRTAAEKLDADIAAYQAERAAQQPLAGTPEGLATQAEAMNAPAPLPSPPSAIPEGYSLVDLGDGVMGVRRNPAPLPVPPTPVPPVPPVPPIPEPEPAPIPAPRPTHEVIPEVVETTGLPLQELASAARTSTEGIVGKKTAQELLAEQAAPSKPVVEAATRLGIIDSLQPDHVTTNQAFRELSQAIKSYPGSPLRSAELEGLGRVADRADKIITDLGADKDVSSLSQKVKTEMQSTIDDLQAHARTMYDGLRDKVPPTDLVSAPKTLDFIQQRATNLGGETYLSPIEKTVLARLSDKSKPTYARLDDVRRDLTAAKYKNQGAFKDADSYLIDQIESALKEDQRSALGEIAKRNGLDPAAMIADFDLAQKTAAAYKGMQSRMIALFGKQLDGNIARSLKNAVNGLSIGDTKSFVNIINSIPESMRGEAVANGLAYAFERNAGAINHNTFANFWNGIKRQGEANKLLKQYLPPESYNALNDLGIVSESISKASKERIVTGRLNVVNETLKEADTMIGKLYEKAKAGAGAALGAEAISATAGAPGLGIAIGSVMALLKDKPPIHLAIDNLLGSKEFRDMIATKSKMEALRGQK